MGLYKGKIQKEEIASEFGRITKISANIVLFVRINGINGLHLNSLLSRKIAQMVNTWWKSHLKIGEVVFIFNSNFCGRQLFHIGKISLWLMGWDRYQRLCSIAYALVFYTL